MAMTPKLDRCDVMTYVVSQVRAMIQEGMDPEDALKSIEQEILFTRFNELTLMKSYANTILGVLEPEYRAELERLNQKG